MLKFFIATFFCFSSAFAQLSQIQRAGSTEVNLLPNPGFEAKKAGWTNSAGSFTLETTSPLAGNASGKFNSSASSQTVSSAAYQIPAGFEGRKCQLHIHRYKYASGSTGDYNVKVMDGDGNVVTSPIDFAVTGSTSTSSIFQTFDCPFLNGSNNTDQLKVVITSTADGGDLIIDDIFLGQGRSQFSSSQANIYGTLTYAGVTSCSWSTATTMASIAADTDCNAPTVTGQASAPATKVPAIKFSYLPAGNYEVDVIGSLYTNQSTSGTAECNFDIYDGTTSKGKTTTTTNVNTGGDSIPGTSGYFSYGTAQSNVQFELRAGRASGNGSCAIDASTSLKDLVIVVKQIPAAPYNGASYETSGWYVSATIPTVFTLPTTTTASTTAPSDSSGALTNYGTISASIACTSTNQATGTTCSSGSEEPGITFNVPSPGAYNACVSFSHSMSDSSGATATDGIFNWTLNETPNAAQTVTTQLGDVALSRLTTVDVSQITTVIHPTTICRIGNFTTAGLKTLRLMFTSTVGGTLSSSSVQNTTFTVYPISQQMPTPVFADYNQSLLDRVKADGNGAQPVLFSGYIANTGSTCTNTGPSAYVASTTRGGTGSCTMNYQPGKFNTGMNCITTSSVTSIPHVAIGSATTSSIVFNTYNTSHASADGNFFYICTGF